MKRRYRTFAAVVAGLALAFAQVAMSAYACSGPMPDPVAMAQMKAQMADDDGACERHCDESAVTFEVAKPSFPPAAAFAIAAPLRVTLVLQAVPAACAAMHPPSIAGPAPPLIRFTVLRI